MPPDYQQHAIKSIQAGCLRWAKTVPQKKLRLPLDCATLRSTLYIATHPKGRRTYDITRRGITGTEHPLRHKKRVPIRTVSWTLDSLRGMYSLRWRGSPQDPDREAQQLTNPNIAQGSAGSLPSCGTRPAERWPAGSGAGDN